MPYFSWFFWTSKRPFEKINFMINVTEFIVVFCVQASLKDLFFLKMSTTLVAYNGYLPLLFNIVPWLRLFPFQLDPVKEAFLNKIFNFQCFNASSAFGFMFYHKSYLSLLHHVPRLHCNRKVTDKWYTFWGLKFYQIVRGKVFRFRSLSFKLWDNLPEISLFPYIE